MRATVFYGTALVLGGIGIGAACVLGDWTAAALVAAAVAVAFGMVLVAAPGAAAAPALAPAAAPGDAISAPEGPRCAKCREPTVYVPEFGRYYCRRDRRYV